MKTITFTILGWIFLVILFLLPESIVFWFFPLILWAVASIIITGGFIALAIVALIQDIFAVFHKKCKN